MAVKFIAETDTLEQFRTTFNELCAQDFGDKQIYQRRFQRLT